MGRPVKVRELVERTCRRCAKTAPCAEFISDRGLSTTLCRDCNKQISSARYAANREEAKTQQRARRAARVALDPETVRNEESEQVRRKHRLDPIRYKLEKLKIRARKFGVPFDLVAADIAIPTHCPVLGLALRGFGEGRAENAPEFDRLVPALGYVRGNVAIISRRANRIKNDGTLEEHERIVEWMRKRGVK